MTVIDPDADVYEAIPVDDRTTTATSVVAWVAVVVAVLALAWWVWFGLLFGGGGTIVDRYVDGDVGETYFSQRDGFTAIFPTKPTRTNRPNDNGPGAVVESKVGTDWSFSVSWQTEPSEALEDAAGTLNIAAGQLASDAGGQIVSQSDPVTFLDVEVKDFVWRDGDRWFHTRLTLSIDRLYVIQVRGPNDDAAPWERLTETFQGLAV